MAVREGQKPQQNAPGYFSSDGASQRGSNQRGTGVSPIAVRQTGGVPTGGQTAPIAVRQPTNLPPTKDGSGIKGLSGPDRNAYVALKSLFDSYGLGSLAPDILKYIQQGYSSDTITILLQQTQAYKQRFAGNIAREKAGLPVLSPAEYLSTEDSYRQIMQSAGLPNGFYNTNQDFTKFIGDDISPSELQSRVSYVSNALDTFDTNQLNYFKKYYTKGDMIAYALDPNRAAPLVGQAFQAAQIGGIAADQGISVGKGMATQLAKAGIDSSSASAGFAQVALDQPNENFLSEITDDKSFTNNDLEKSVFLNDAQQTQRAQNLASQERARFGGSSGVGSDSLARTNKGL